jgi:hypothetical protein
MTNPIGLLPCGHPIADSLFTFETGGRGPIVHPPVRNEAAHIDLSATVWCTKGCGWVDVDDAAYGQLKGVRV